MQGLKRLSVPSWKLWKAMRRCVWQSDRVNKGLASLSVKDQAVNILGFETLLPLTQRSTWLLWPESIHRQRTSARGWLCPKQTLLTKTSGGPHFSDPSIQSRKKRARDKKWEYPDDSKEKSLYRTYVINAAINQCMLERAGSKQGKKIGNSRKIRLKGKKSNYPPSLPLSWLFIYSTNIYHAYASRYTMDSAVCMKRSQLALTDILGQWKGNIQTDKRNSHCVKDRKSSVLLLPRSLIPTALFQRPLWGSSTPGTAVLSRPLHWSLLLWTWPGNMLSPPEVEKDPSQVCTVWPRWSQESEGACWRPKVKQGKTIQCLQQKGSIGLLTTSHSAGASAPIPPPSGMAVSTESGQM